MTSNIMITLEGLGDPGLSRANAPPEVELETFGSDSSPVSAAAGDSEVNRIPEIGLDDEFISSDDRDQDSSELDASFCTLLNQGEVGPSSGPSRNCLDPLSTLGAKISELELDLHSNHLGEVAESIRSLPSSIRLGAGEVVASARACPLPHLPELSESQAAVIREKLEGLAEALDLGEPDSSDLTQRWAEQYARHQSGLGCVCSACWNQAAIENEETRGLIANLSSRNCRRDSITVAKRGCGELMRRSLRRAVLDTLAPAPPIRRRAPPNIALFCEPAPNFLTRILMPRPERIVENSSFYSPLYDAVSFPPDDRLGWSFFGGELLDRYSEEVASRHSVCVGELIKLIPVLPNCGAIIGKLRTCAQCNPPSWASFFEVGDDFGHCLHTGNLRIIEYADLTYPAAVHVVACTGNLLLIDTAAEANLLRVMTKVVIYTRLSDHIAGYRWITRKLLDVVGAADVYNSRHRYAELRIDLSKILWFRHLAGAPSSDNFRKNLAKFMDSNGSAVYWAQNAMDLSYSWHIYAAALSFSSPSLTKGVWEIPKFLHIYRPHNYAREPPYMGPIQGPVCSAVPVTSEDFVAPVQHWEGGPLVVGEGVVVVDVKGSIEPEGAGVGMDLGESVIEAVVRLASLPLAEQQSGINFLEPPRVEGEPRFPDEEKDEEEGQAPEPVSSEYQSVSVSGSAVTPGTNWVEVVKRQNTERLLKDHTEQEVLLRRELDVMIEQLSLPDPITMTPTELLDPEIKFIKSDVNKMLWTPGQHDWKGSFLVPKMEQGVVVGKVKPRELVIKDQTGVLHGQIYGDIPFHYPSDSLSQFQALSGRVACVKPKAASSVTFKQVRFRRMKLEDLKNSIPESLSCTEDLQERDFWGAGRASVEALVASMGKPQSRKRMTDLIGKLFAMDVTWDESARVFKIFTKSDDKIGKHKARIIQFAPSVLWIIFIRRLSKVVTNIKKKWSWYDRVTKTHFIWASGMTQQRLSETVAYMLRENKKFVLLCGDDNTDLWGDADAGKYDSTQRGFFFDCQKELLGQFGFSKDEIELITIVHKGERSLAGFSAQQLEDSLPSGAPWTLFLNTIGLVVYYMQLERVKFYARQRKLAITHPEAVAITAELLGLEMTFNPAPNVEEEDMNGSEFLKGIFIRGKTQRLYWVPLPSRLHKWGSKIFQSKGEKEDWMRLMDDHLFNVANGQKDFILDPLARVWVNAWVKKGGKHRKLAWEWKNILYSEGFSLDPDDEKHWIETWKPIMAARYGIDGEEYEEMLACLAKHATEMGEFSGAGWCKLWRRDYLGDINAIG